VDGNTTEINGVSDQEILEAVIGSIGDIDSPQSPDGKGYTSLSRYLNGGTPEDRQQWRDEILATNAQDFKTFADKLKKLSASGTTVVFGSETALQSANNELKDEGMMQLEHAFPRTESNVTGAKNE
jgi:Zn-dependent M16 (insulinase) family peptidase